jgi:hypothetical protein
MVIEYDSESAYPIDDTGEVWFKWARGEDFSLHLQIDGKRMPKALMIFCIYIHMYIYTKKLL